MVSRNSFPDVRTGDALLFSSNTTTGYLLRTLTSSLWNHSGIAVRIHRNGRVSLNGRGDLYILEINTTPRIDEITAEKVKGAGYTKIEWAMKKYNIISYRPMVDRYRTRNMIHRLKSFVDKYKGYDFTTDFSPFITVGIGVPIDGTNGDDVWKKDMFCSEFMAHFYSSCLGPTIEEVDGIRYKNKISDLFGEGSPEVPILFSPNHYSYDLTPDSIIFSGKERPIFTMHSNWRSVLLPTLIITFFILVILYMTLP